MLEELPAATEERFLQAVTKARLRSPYPALGYPASVGIATTSCQPPSGTVKLALH